MMTRTHGGRWSALVLFGVALSLGLVAIEPAEAQVRRGVTQRTTPRNAETREQRRQGQVLLDRFAQRVGQALRLDGPTTERLLRELQASRAERGRIQAQMGAIRRELTQLIQEEPADEERIGALIEEFLDLEVARAEVSVDEQRRLSEFMTPLQRARLIWFQQQAARQALQRGTDGPIP